MAFAVTRILLSFLTVVVLFAGSLQGAISYSDYCNDNDDHDVLESIIDYNKKWCDFSSSGKYNSDVDFIAVVVLAGIGALLWVSLVFLLLFNSNSKSVNR